MSKKDGTKKLGKKVLKHLKEDTHESLEQIQDDKKLGKNIKKTMKKHGAKCEMGEKSMTKKKK